MRRVLVLAVTSILSVAALSAQQKKEAPAPSNSSKTATERKTRSERTAPASVGPIDLNTASQEQLEALPGVGPATAKKIMGGRPFASVADLKRVGMSASTISKIGPSVMVSPAQQPGGAPARPTRTEAARPSPTPTASTSSQGGGNGQVWVNLESKIYHYQGDRYYGKTKNGKYMNEQDAVRAGYRASKTVVK
jgi:hypothetical protein